jgi:hypothetical protein
VFVLVVVLLQTDAAAATLFHDGPATPEQLSIFIPSSLPPEATATVRYRKVGSSTWIVGHPLHRIRPGFADSRMTVEDGFAWPMIGLTPGTSYEVEVTITHGLQITVDTGVMAARRNLTARPSDCQPLRAASEVVHEQETVRAFKLQVLLVY